MALVKETKKKFIDLDLNMSRHPLTNDVPKLIDLKAITASLKMLIMSRIYDHPFHPEIASPVAGMLFEQLIPSEIAGVRRQIEYLIENFEPRVTLQTVDISPDYINRAISITIYFRVIGLPNTYTVNFVLNRMI